MVQRVKVQDGKITYSNSDSALSVDFQIDGRLLADNIKLTTNLDFSNTATATNLPYPLSDTDAANKYYVDTVAAGLSWKAAVIAATITDITLSGLQVVDGVSVASGDRVLVKSQLDSTENGIYIASTSAWSRSPDMDSTTPINEINGAAVFVSNGSTMNDTGWVQINNVSVIGVDPISFTQFSGSGSYTAGTGLQLSGTVFSNTGVLSLAGTANQISTSGSSGNITLNLPSTLSGLSSITSTTFNGALNGNATSSTSLSGGLAGAVVFQSASGVTSYTSVGNAGQALVSGGTGSPTWMDFPSTSVTLTGDVTGTGTGTINTSLANSGVTAGTYTKVTVNSKGIVTTGSNPTTLAGYGIVDAAPIHSPTFTGVVTSPTTNITGTLSLLPTGGQLAVLMPSLEFNNYIEWKNTSGIGIAILGSGTAVSPGYSFTDYGIVASGKLLLKSSNGVIDLVSGSGGVVNVTSTTPSSSYTTGALVVSGGIGIAGVINSNGATIRLNAPSGQSSVYLAQGGVNNGRIYAGGGPGTDINIDAQRFIGMFPASRFFVNIGTVDKLSVDTTSTSVLQTTTSSSTTTGALVVSGGVGVGGSLYANLVNAPTLVGALTGNASTSTSLLGGSLGAVPYQSASGTTSFVSPGLVGQVLTSTGVGAPQWASPGVGSVTLIGDVTGTGTGTINTSLANSGVTAGTYTKVTVNSKGIVTTGSNPTTLAGYGIVDAVNKAGDTMTGSLIVLADVESKGVNSASITEVGSVFHDYTSNFGGALLRSYGSTSGNVTLAGLPRQGLQELLFQNGTAGVISTNNPAQHLYLAANYKKQLELDGSTDWASVKSYTDSFAGQGMEVIGARTGDSNGTFQSRIGLGFWQNTGTPMNGQAVGMLAFGGQYGTSTSFTPSNIAYAASIKGIAESPWTSSGTMSTAIVFYTGTIGDDLRQPNQNYGNERMRITSVGEIQCKGNVTVSPAFTTPLMDFIPYDDVSNYITFRDSAAFPICYMGAGDSAVVPAYTSGDTVIRAINSLVFISDTDNIVFENDVYGLQSITAATFHGHLMGTAQYLIGGTAGAVAYQSSPNITAFTSAGTAGQVLTSNGSGAPTWTTLSSSATWTTLTGKPESYNWVTSASTEFVAGQLGWQAQGNNYTIIDASSGFAPDGTPLTSNVNPDGGYGVGNPTLMGYDGTGATYGVRVDMSHYSENMAGGSGGRIPYQVSSSVTAFTAAGTAGQVLTSNGTGAPTWTTLSSSATWTTLTGKPESNNWVTSASTEFVAGQLGWQAQGNNYTIIDASSGFAPDGTPLTSIVNPDNTYGSGFPTLMGYDGAGITYGVRVDSSRYSNSLTNGSGGQIPYQSSTSTTAFTATGTTGQVLTSNGTGAPTWTTPASAVTWSTLTGKPDNTTWPSAGSIVNVVGQLAWRQFGSGHTIFDASAGISPDGLPISSNMNPDSGYGPGNPTLMGYDNAGVTYGVRVDSSRKADNVLGGSSGQIPYQSSASTTAFTATGTTGQILVSGGSSSPTWTSSPVLAQPSQLFQSLGSVSGAVSINGASGIHVLATAGGNITWTFPSPASNAVMALTLELTNGGAFTMTWPAGIRWTKGVPPTLTASGTDVLTFTKAGTNNWRGYFSSEDSK